MNPRSRLLLIATTAATMVGASAPAQAQATGSRAGFFGASASSATRPQTLDFTLSLLEAHDSDVPAELGSRLDRRSPQLGGFFTMLVAGADYARHRPRVDFGATVGSAVRYYSRIDEVRADSHNAGVGFSARLGGQTTVFVNQTAAYSPSYFYHLFPTVTASTPGDAMPMAPDYDVDEFQSYSYATTLRVTHGSSRGNSVTATGDFNHTDWQSNEGRPDFRTYGAGAEFAHGLARTGGISGGYRYRTSESGYGRGPTTEHRVNLGVGFTPALSITRRARFHVNVALSALDLRESAEFGVAAGRQHRLFGDLAVAYPFRRTWQARAAFSRGLTYIPALGEPVVADGATMSLDGFMTYRLNLSAGAGYAQGQSLRSAARSFDTYTGDVTLRYGWTRTVGVFAEYLYYFYDFRRSTEIAPGFPRSLERNGARVGVVLWIPALGR